MLGSGTGPVLEEVEVGAASEDEDDEAAVDAAAAVSASGLGDPTIPSAGALSPAICALVSALDGSHSVIMTYLGCAWWNSNPCFAAAEMKSLFSMGTCIHNPRRFWAVQASMLAASTFSNSARVGMASRDVSGTVTPEYRSMLCCNRPAWGATFCSIA